jgi:hypothetical protein
LLLVDLKFQISADLSDVTFNFLPLPLAKIRADFGEKLN